MKAILRPYGRLLIPKPPEDLDEPEGPAAQEIGPDHPDFARWLGGGPTTAIAEYQKMVSIRSATRVRKQFNHGRPGTG
jgi:hypothetical protein